MGGRAAGDGSTCDGEHVAQVTRRLHKHAEFPSWQRSSCLTAWKFQAGTQQCTRTQLNSAVHAHPVELSESVQVRSLLRIQQQNDRGLPKLVTKKVVAINVMEVSAMTCLPGCILTMTVFDIERSKCATVCCRASCTAVTNPTWCN